MKNEWADSCYKVLRDGKVKGSRGPALYDQFADYIVKEKPLENFPGLKLPLTKVAVQSAFKMIVMELHPDKILKKKDETDEHFQEKKIRSGRAYEIAKHGT